MDLWQYYWFRAVAFIVFWLGYFLLMTWAYVGRPHIFYRQKNKK